MRPLRSALIVIAVIAAAGDGFLFLRPSQPAHRSALLTYVGFDSLGVIVPADKEAAALRNGRWEPSLQQAKLIAGDMGGQKRALFLVTLAPQATYDHFIETVHALRASGACNVLIREGGEAFKSQVPLEDGSRDAVAIQALVLCGSEIGDAGFNGRLPPDRKVLL